MVQISAQSEHFSVRVLKVSHSQFWLFKPIFRHLDPESGSGFRIRIRIPAQIECGSNRIRIRIRNTAVLYIHSQVHFRSFRAEFLKLFFVIPRTFMKYIQQIQLRIPTASLFNLGPQSHVSLSTVLSTGP